MNPAELNWIVSFGDIILKSSLILGLGWLATKLVKRGPAATRHLLWIVALGATLFVPILEYVAPHRSLVTISQPAQAPVEPKSDAFSSASLDELPAMSDLPVDTSALPTVENVEPQPPAPAPPSRPRTLVIWAGAAWVFGSLGVLFSALVGWISLRRIRSHNFLQGENAFSMKVGRSFRIKVSQEDRPPTALTWGIFPATILLPKASETWPRERLQTVLMHEIEHVRRRDAAKQLLGLAACCLYWFNPLMWLAAKAARSEAESATDDAVLRSGVRPSLYANTLLEVAAEIGSQRPFQTSPGVAFMKKTKIETRVRAILDNRVRRSVTRNEKIVAITLATAVLCPLAAVHAAGVKPFADLPNADDPTISVATQSDVLQTREEERAAAAHQHHLRVLAIRLIARQKEFMAAQAHVAKLRANIRELSRKLGMVPQDEPSPKQQLESQYRTAFVQLREAQKALRSVQPPAMAPSVAIPTQPFREVPQGALPSAIHDPTYIQVAPPAAMGPRPGEVADAPQALANPFTAPPVASVPRPGGIAGPPQAPGNSYIVLPPPPGIRPGGVAWPPQAPHNPFSSTSILPGARPGGAQTLIAMGSTPGPQPLANPDRELENLTAQIKRLQSIVVTASEQSELEKLRAEKAAMQAQIAVLRATSIAETAQARAAQAKAATLTARKANQERLSSSSIQQLKDLLEIAHGPSESIALMNQRLNGVRLRIASGKLHGESLKRAKLQAERLKLLIRVKQIEADLNK